MYVYVCTRHIIISNKYRISNVLISILSLFHSRVASKLIFDSILHPISPISPLSKSKCHDFTWLFPGFQGLKL